MDEDERAFEWDAQESPIYESSFDRELKLDSNGFQADGTKHRNELTIFDLTSKELRNKLPSPISKVKVSYSRGV